MLQKFLALFLCTLIPTIMLAHGSHGSGVMAGFTHPILGVDHNVAIVGSGILGYVINHKKWFIFPLAFISAMVVGGFLGIGNEATFTIEKIIALSVFLIGLVTIFRMRLNLIIIAIALAIFGFFHGYAHGAEMPESNTAMKYIPGFTLGAVLLALIGFLIGKTAFTKSSNDKAITLVAGIIIGCGIMMLLT